MEHLIKINTEYQIIWLIFENESLSQISRFTELKKGKTSKKNETDNKEIVKKKRLKIKCVFVQVKIESKIDFVCEDYFLPTPNEEPPATFDVALLTFGRGALFGVVDVC